MIVSKTNINNTNFQIHKIREVKNDYMKDITIRIEKVRSPFMHMKIILTSRDLNLELKISLVKLILQSFYPSIRYSHIDHDEFLMLQQHRCI